MYPDDITDPVPLGSRSFFEQDGDSHSRFTLAAYLLLTGMLFVRRDDIAEERLELPSDEEFETLGIRRDASEQVPFGEADFREFSRDDIDGVPSAALADYAAGANERGNPADVLRLIAAGCKSDDELIRICALGSAVDLFRRQTIDMPGQIAWFFRNARERETFELLGVLLARTNPSPAIGYLAGPTTTLGTTTKGLMAIHGTVLPHTQSNRPEWSVPPNGSLFSHLKSLRSDIYGSPDFFRWEGGYTDYAREVAMTNLRDWVSSRSLHGIDVVAHSHGCNVVMGSTALGIDYTKIVLLSCPVHWSKYNLLPAKITKDVVSIRTRVDFVIMMDRGGQRFPAGTIKDVILPFWFTSHSATTKPKNWQTQGLDKYLM